MNEEKKGEKSVVAIGTPNRQGQERERELSSSNSRRRRKDYICIHTSLLVSLLPPFIQGFVSWATFVSFVFNSAFSLNSFFSFLFVI